MKLEQLQIKRNYNHLMLPLTITLSLIVIRVIELIFGTSASSNKKSQFI